MLKTTRSLDKLSLSRNNGSRSAFSKNDNGNSDSKKNKSNSEVNKFGGDNMEHTKKSKKSKKLSKSRKKPPKSGNSPKFGTKKVGINILISDARIAYNYLWLAFIKAPIFDILIQNVTFGSRMMYRVTQLAGC